MNISIRKWRLEDAADLAAALNNKRVLDNLRDGLPFPYTESDGREFIFAMLAANPDDTFSFAITVDDRAVGSIGAFRQGNIHRQSAEMGYYADEVYWNRGVCTAAVRLTCRHIFENTDIIRIFAEPFAHNAASCRVLEKAGFQYEGTLRSAAVKNGQALDMKIFSCLKQDFK
jgi:RimJ/RimL family protein N-acetyltransferase